LSFELPVLNQNRGPIAEAEARRRESAARFDALQARVIGEIDTALAGCRNARQKFAVATELLSQAQKQEHAAEEMARVGGLSRQAVATARLETANIGLARLDALLKVQQAAATLENALQLPLELPESLINAPVQMESTP
jgi:outer membrane protein TolC